MFARDNILLLQPQDKILLLQRRVLFKAYEYDFNRQEFDEEIYENPHQSFHNSSYIPLPPVFELACRKGFFETVQHFLSKRREEELCKWDLFTVIEKGHNDIIPLLINAGISPTDCYFNEKPDTCPLAYSIEKNNTKAVELLLSYGASLDDMTVSEKDSSKTISVRERIEEIKASKSQISYTFYENGIRRETIKPTHCLSPEMLDLLEQLDAQASCRI